MIDPVIAVQPNTDLREIANPPTTAPISPKSFCKILGGFAFSSAFIGFGVFVKCVIATRNTDPAKSQCFSDEMPIGFALGCSALGIIKAGVILAEEIDRRCSRRQRPALPLTRDELDTYIDNFPRTTQPSMAEGQSRQPSTAGNQRDSIEVLGGEGERDDIGIIINPRNPNNSQVTGEIGVVSGNLASTTSTSPSPASVEVVQSQSAHGANV